MEHLLKDLLGLGKLLVLEHIEPLEVHEIGMSLERDLRPKRIQLIFIILIESPVPLFVNDLEHLAIGRVVYQHVVGV